MWQAQYTELPGGAAARVAAAGPQRAVVWQAQYTELPGGAAHRASWRSCGARGRRCPAAAFRVAGAVHRASWRRCGARGRRSPAAGSRVAGAIHRASWRSCGACGRRWPRLAFEWQAHCTELPGGAVARVAAAGRRRAVARLGGAAARVPAAGQRLAFVWQAQYTEPPGRAAVRAWPPLARGGLSCCRRSTQSLLKKLLHASRSHTHTHYFSPTIPVTHTVFHTPSFTPLCQTPSFTFHL